MKILLIDDSVFSRNVIKRALGDEYTYVEAPDGLVGLEKFFVEKPDLVILDLTMPGSNGMETLSRIREVDPNARVLIGTADIQDLTRLEAEKLGISGFLNKPFTNDNVKEAVEKALSGKPA